MNVIFNIKDKEYVVTLIDAKKILKSVYVCAKAICVNGVDIGIDRATRMDIMKQLHGELYV